MQINSLSPHQDNACRCSFKANVDLLIRAVQDHLVHVDGSEVKRKADIPSKLSLESTIKTDQFRLPLDMEGQILLLFTLY